MTTLSLPASALRVGMVVHTHRMRVRLDTVTEYPAIEGHASGMPVYSCHGTVLDRADDSPVPIGWLLRTEPDTGVMVRPAQYDYWAVQSNDLCTWTVEQVSA